MREMASGEGAALVVLRCSDSIHQQPFQLHYRLHVLYLVGELNQTVTEVHRTASPIILGFFGTGMMVGLLKHEGTSHCSEGTAEHLSGPDRL